MTSVVDSLDELADALDRAVDLVAGVVGLLDGRLGGETGSTTLRGKLLRLGDHLGRSSIVRGLAATHGPEQLRKAAAEVERAEASLVVLRRSGAVDAVVDRLVATGLPGGSTRLRAAVPASTTVAEVLEMLVGASAVVDGERIRVRLAERRGGHRTSRPAAGLAPAPEKCEIAPADDSGRVWDTRTA